MKARQFFMVAAAAAMLAACTKGEVVYDDSDVAIAFSPVAQMSTKAPVYGPMNEPNSAYDTDETFGIFAYHKVTDQTTWSNFYSSEGNTQTPSLYINNGEFEFRTGSVYGGVTPYYWPKTGLLAFAGYSPYEGLRDLVNINPDGTNPSIKIPSFSQGSYSSTISNSKGALSVTNQTVDVMWFDLDDAPIVNYGSAGTASTGVPVKFRHACAWLDFNLSASHPDGGADAKGLFKILKVTLKNVYTKGAFDSNKVEDAQSGTAGNETVTLDEKNPWTNFGYATENTKDIVLFSYDQGQLLGTAGTAIGEAASDDPKMELTGLLVIPQSLDQVAEVTAEGQEIAAKSATVLEIEYQQMTSASQTPNTEKFVAAITGSNVVKGDGDAVTDPGDWLYGRHYVYNITFGLDEILISPSVVDWVDENKTINN